MDVKSRLMAKFAIGIAVTAVGLPALYGNVAAAQDMTPTPTVLQLRQSYLDQPFSSLTFRSMDKFYWTRTVPHAAPKWPIPRNDHKLDFTYSFEGKTYAPDEFLERTFTNALIVIKDGRIVYETYRNGATENDRFMGFSMTKSITSILIGKLVEQGRIRSIDDPVTDYLPELKTGGYNGVPIRNILQMRSGAYRNETYTPKDPESQPPGSPMAALRDNVSRYVDAAPTIATVRKPGEKFFYLNLDTAVLGLLVERLSGNTIAGFTAQHLWEPMGAEADSFFVLDGAPGVGREFNVAGFNATARDWARVGLLMLNDGKAGGRQVVSPAWVAASTKPIPTGEPSEQGYGYQWWTTPDNAAFMAQGHLGQFVYVNRKAKTVIVKLSYFPAADAKQLGKESHAFFAAAAAWNPK